MKSAVLTEWRAAASELYVPCRWAPICAEQHRLTLDMQAIKAVATAMKDSSKDVRLAAVNMIQFLVKSGDDLAIGAVGACLQDPDQKVRDAASRILPKLSSEFDERLVNEVLLRAGNMHAVVRKTMIQTLVTVSTKGAPMVVDALIKACHDFDASVKTLAVTELAKQVGRGNAAAVQAVGEQLGDSRMRVREAAAAALAGMATKADRQVIAKLVGVMDDCAADHYGHLSVSVAALVSIREISAADRSEDFSPRIRELMSTTIRKHFKSQDWCVRKEAVTTLVWTAPAANRQEVLHTLVDMIQDVNIQVRIEAIAMLESYKEGLDKWVFSGIACLLVSPAGHVRQAASDILSKLLDKKLDDVKVDFFHRIRQGKLPTNGEVIGMLSIIVNRGDEGYLNGFLLCMRHSLSAIRSLASSAIQSICIPGQISVVDELIRNFTNSSPSVKCDNILTLSKVVLKNDDRAAQIVQDMLSDPDLDVKKMVSVALKNMLAEGDSRRTVALACVQLDSGFHTDIERKGALEQLGELAYSSSKFQLDGWSVEDADMQRFWVQINQPRGPSNASDKFVPKILKSLEDETAWVRRAGGVTQMCLWIYMCGMVGL